MVVAAGGLAAGVANAFEDGLGVSSLGKLYVLGFLTAGLALLPLAATLWWAGCLRLAVLAVALFLGVLLSSVGGGLIVLVALGGLALATGWFMRAASPTEQTAE